MTLERRTFLSSVEPQDNGAVQVRIGLRTTLDGRVIETLWHRTIVEPGTSPTDQIAFVNSHLAVLETGPWPPLEDAGMTLLNQVCETMHTPDVVAAFELAKAATFPHSDTV